jgi:Collagen triple helix repeat (20 copies)
MIKRWFARRSARLIVLVVVVGGVAAGVAYATGAIPGANGTIQGCYDSGGNLKVVASLPCPHGYTALAWSQTGPAGKNGTNGTNGTNGKDGTNGTNGAQGSPGKDGTNGTNGTDGAPGAPGPASLDALNGTPCTFNGHPSKTRVTVDSTNGAVSIVCTPVYEVSVSVSGGTMSAVLFRYSVPALSQQFSDVGSGGASIILPEGTPVLVSLLSGTIFVDGHSFTFTCPGGSSGTAFEHHAGLFGSAPNDCQTNSLSGDFAVTATFSG